MKVLITRKIPKIAEELFLKKGYKLDINKKDAPIQRDVLIKKAKKADAIISMLNDKFDKDVIDSLQNCKVISNYAVGHNNIDSVYAKSKNIIVTNTPDILTDATADIAFSLILACARRIVESEKFLREGKFDGWKPELLLGLDLKGKTIGIVGAGRIGQATAKRAAGFGMKILYTANSKKAVFEKELGAKKVSLNTLLKKSDVISLHCPLTPKTNKLLDDEKLSLLKETAILVNTARGEIIDESALLELLRKKKIFSVGMDVFENEPKINKKLLKFKNVIVLPHIGSGTIETRSKMAELVAKNVINVLNGKNPITPV